MTSQDSRPGGAAGRTLAWVFGIDLIAVLVFSVLGRGAHNRTPGIAGVLETAWPFLIALVVAWIFWLLRKKASNPLGASMAGYVWVVTLVVGMIVRGLSTGRIPHWSFMIVAAIALAILFFGWRAIAGFIARRR